MLQSAMKARDQYDDEPIAIGFVCANAAPLFDSRERGYCGGMEKRAWLFATELARRYADCRIRFFIRSNIPRPSRETAGVQLVDGRAAQPWVQRIAHATYPYVQFHRSWPYVRITKWRQSLVWKIPCRLAWAAWSIATFARLRAGPRPRPHFNRFQVDVFVTFGVCPDSADAIASARRLGVPSVLMVAANAELLLARQEHVDSRSEWQWRLATYCINEPDFVVVQTEAQQRLLSGAPLKRETQLIRNPVDLRPGNCNRANGDAHSIVWVGRSDSHHKRPAICLELARMLPAYRFTMVMNRESDDIFNDIARQAPPNVQIVERASPAEMMKLFSSAEVFVSTSVAAEEGFPNVMLEAAVCGAVVVSLEADPDGLLSDGSLGICCSGDLVQMVKVVDHLMSNVAERRIRAERAAAYVRANHDLETQVQQLHEFLVRIVNATNRKPQFSAATG